ncbi:MAG: DUF3822 family protein [Candidatus Cyclobacteriaceae bacterium M3_2C_046]
MYTEDKKYQLVHKVKDRRHFNIDHLEHYSLLLQVGISDFQLCVTDTRDDSCLLLEDYTFSRIESVEDLVECLRELFYEHHFLLANFWKSVTLSVKSKKFTLIPNDLFSEEELPHYLKFNAQLDPDSEDYYYSPIKWLDANSIFAVDSQLIDFINSIYIKISVQIVHQGTALIESLFQNINFSQQKEMYVYLDRINMHIVVLENQKLILYNQFTIKSFSDYVKYMMLVKNELQIDINSQPVHIWGYFNEHSPHMQEISKYIKNIKIGGGPSFLKRGFVFDEIPEHHYLDVYGIYLCA